MILARRAKAGKEDPDRLAERLVKGLPERPPGKLVWMHGASVGEAQILLGLSELMAKRDGELSFLFTSQTLTSSELVKGRALPRTLHQMAPIDTPGASKRFIQHWHPELVVFAEGEIWPNLIRHIQKQGYPLALVNARMTEKSRMSWARWPRFAKRLFGAFDLILPADESTGKAIAKLSNQAVEAPANLKRGLPPPPVNAGEVARLKRSFVAERPCILAASTHDREEDLFMNAISDLQADAAVILAPRHPERGPLLAETLENKGIPFAQRSAGQIPTKEHKVLLADTIGEMGLWYRLSDTVFLGGASVPNIGGHNPIEALQFGKTLATGPYGFNFEALFEELSHNGLLNIVADRNELAQALERGLSIKTGADRDAREAFLTKSAAPLEKAADALLALLYHRIRL